MTNTTRKSLDQFSEQSETFEIQFEAAFADRADEPARTRLIEEIAAWLQDGAQQGRFVPLTSADRRAFRSVLDRWNSRLRQHGLQVEGIDHLADFDPHAGVVLTGDCPYPGLDPYKESRRGTFFGRESLVSASVAHLEQPGNRILLIIGASGSGKSSLALAGILPQLKEKHDGSWLFGPPLTPGAHPLSALAESVARAIGRDDQAGAIEQQLATNPADAVGALAGLCAEQPLVLLIDQFEELLTLCNDAGEQGVFAQVLCALSEKPTSAGSFCCRTILTLRTDHLARFESNNVLKPLHVRLIGENNEQYLSGIGFNDIKRAIKEPAEKVGLRFNPVTLIDQLASQTAGLANGLPLLQFALQRLWDTRPKDESGQPLDLITDEMVRGLPDVERALGTVAEGLFLNFSPTQQQICERLLLELVVLDESFEEPLRRRRNEAQLKQVLQERFPSAPDVDRVVEDFVAEGLLRRFGEDSEREIEVAHEALLRHWDRIYELLTGAEVKERLLLIKQIFREANDWAGRGKTDGYLSLRGERLDRAVACVSDGWVSEPTSHEYVDACVRRQQTDQAIERRAKGAERFRRRTFWAAAAVLVLFALVVSWAYYRTREESFAQRLAMASEDEADRDSQRALLLAVEAARHGHAGGGGLAPGVERALRSAVRASSVRLLVKGYGGTLILAAAYSPDGATLALGDSMGGVTLWDVPSGVQRKALFAHVDAVQTIAFSPDGRKLATGSKDGRTVIWDAEKAVPLRVLNGHLNEVTALAFNRPDGRVLASASEDGSIRIWNTSTGAETARFYGHTGGVRAIAFGRDEAQLVSAGSDYRVVFWDIQFGRARALYSIQFGTLFDMDLSPDGSLLAVASGRGVEIWNAATRGRRWTITGHTNSVLRVRFGTKGDRVATASHDSTVRVWRLPEDNDTQKQPRELARFTQERALSFTGVAISPQGDTVAATATEGGPGVTLRGAATMWNLNSGEELRAFAASESAVDGVAFTPDGDAIAAVARGVHEWNLSGKRVRTPFDDTPVRGAAIAVSKDGATAIASGREVLVALPKQTSPVRLSGHGDLVSEIKFSPDGLRLVSVSHDGIGIVWDPSTGQRLGSLVPKEAADRLFAVAYSPDGKLIATGGHDCVIRLWDARKLQLLREIEGHSFAILALAFTDDGREVVSGSVDKTVAVWNVETGKQQEVLVGHTDAVWAVAIRGANLATAGDDGVRLWNLRTGGKVSFFPARTQAAHALAFSPDGHYLAAGGNDGIVRVYEMRSEQLLTFAQDRVRRGWTTDECNQFLPRRPWYTLDGLLSSGCPRSRYTLLDEASQHFENGKLTEGEGSLKEADGNDGSGTGVMSAELDARLGTAYLWAADSAFKKQAAWTHPAQGKTEEQVAAAFLDQASKSKNMVFDRRSRLSELRAYEHVKSARSLARRLKVEESITAFQQAKDAGWSLPDDPRTMTRQLSAVALLAEAATALREAQDNGRPLTSKDIQNHTESLEIARNVHPEVGPIHSVLAQFYILGKDFTGAEREYEAAASAEQSGEPLARLAWDIVNSDPRRSVRYADQALERDPSSDIAWYVKGYANWGLKDYRAAAFAFDRVPSSSVWFVDAVNRAATLYFEYLEDDAAAYQRFGRAVDLAPSDLYVLANYAEFLLASNRKDQAELAAASALAHPEAQGPAKTYIRVPMSFVLFSAELLSGERAAALKQLDDLERHVNEAASGIPENSGSWSYKGITRALDRMPADGTDHLQIVRKVLDYVKSNGRSGNLKEVRRLLRPVGV